MEIEKLKELSKKFGKVPVFATGGILKGWKNENSFKDVGDMTDEI